MTRIFRDYARSSVENLDARKAYRWTSGLCAAAALALALDASCVGDKYTPPKDMRNDLEVFVDATQTVFWSTKAPLSDGRTIEIATKQRKGRDLYISHIDGIKIKLEDRWGGAEYFYPGGLILYPSENSFEFIHVTKRSIFGDNIPLTEEETERAKAEYGQVFSDLAKTFRRNGEIEWRLRENVLRTGKVCASRRVPIFDYSWMPYWLSDTFSTTIVDEMEKEYDTGSEKVKVQANTTSSEIEIFFDDELRRMDRSLNCGIYPGSFVYTGRLSDDQKTILDRLAPLVGMEDEK